MSERYDSALEKWEAENPGAVAPEGRRPIVSPLPKACQCGQAPANVRHRPCEFSV